MTGCVARVKSPTAYTTNGLPVAEFRGETPPARDGANLVIGKPGFHVRDFEFRHVAAGTSRGTSRTGPPGMLARRLGASGDVAGQASIVVGAGAAVERPVRIVARRA